MFAPNVVLFVIERSFSSGLAARKKSLRGFRIFLWQFGIGEHLFRFLSWIPNYQMDDTIQPHKWIQMFFSSSSAHTFGKCSKDGCQSASSAKAQWRSPSGQRARDGFRWYACRRGYLRWRPFTRCTQPSPPHTYAQGSGSILLWDLLSIVKFDGLNDIVRIRKH